MNRKLQEPRRVPVDPTVAPEQRVGAGCLALFITPWAISTLFGIFVAAGGPLLSDSSLFGSFFSLIMSLPLGVGAITAVLSLWALAGGKRTPNRVVKNVMGGVTASAIGLFVLSTIAAAFTTSAGAATAMMGMVGIAVFSVVVANFVRKGAKVARTSPSRKRRKHDSPPAPPWSHPLARTERVNLYAEALVDQNNIIALLLGCGLSIALGNPLPLLIVGGLEMIMLALIPDTEWFRRRVERKHAEMAAEQAVELREEQTEYLSTEQLAEHQRMLDGAKRAKEAIDAADYPFDTSRLDRSVDHHLWLMQLENYYADLDVDARLKDIDQRLTGARRDREGANERMAAAFDRRIEVLERRRAQMLELDARLREVSDKRQTLQETMMLVTESALAGSAEFADIDEVLFELQIAEEVVLDLHEEEVELEAQIEQAYAEATA